MYIPFLKHLRPLLMVAAVCAAALLLIIDPLALQTLRNAVFDQYQRWQPRVYQDTGVRIVDIDDESLRRLGQWPWPRTLVADLILKLRAGGAETIAFDVLFAEPDRTAPAALLQGWQLPPQARAAVAALPDPDTLLAAALQGNQTVLGIGALQGAGRVPAPKFGVIVRGPGNAGAVPRLVGAVGALPVLAAAAAGNGAISFIADADGIVRRVPLLVQAGNQLLPSLAAETLRVGTGARNLLVRTDSGGIEGVDIGRWRIPTAADGQVWVHFSAAAPPGRTIPAWQVLAGTVPAAALRHATVIVGTSAQGLQDLRFSPLGGIIPGVEVHAQALEQIRSGDLLQRPQWAPALEASTLLLGCLALGVFALRTGAVVSALGVVATLVAVQAGAWLAYSRAGLLLDGATPSIAIALAYVVASILRHVATEARQRWVRQAFASYVSPNLVAHLLENPQQLELGGRRQDCSFIFTDLAGFTGLVENSTPEAVVAILNAYLDGLIQIAFRHDGTLDRIVGDAIAIMFSAPVAQADHRVRALTCALEMHLHACRYAADLQARGVAFGATRIGVHCGEVVVGNFGGSTIFDYRAMGDAVNTAARLETLNRHIGTTICVSEAIRAANPTRPMRTVGRVVLKGKSQPIGVFEPLLAGTAGCADAAPATPVPSAAPQGSAVVSAKGDALAGDSAYDAAYGLIANDPLAALLHFEALRAARPDDGLVAFQLQRLVDRQYDDLIVMLEK